MHRRRSALGAKGAGTATGLRTPSIRRLVSHHRQPSNVAAEYGSPPEVAGTPAPGSAFMILARPLAAS